MKTDSRFLGQYLSTSYTQLQSVIRQADTKANIIIALIGVILSLFFNFFVSRNLIPTWQVIIVLITFILSGSFALSTLYPREAKKSGKFSLIYYKDAINTNTSITDSFISNNEEKKIIKDYIENINALSRIIEKKFSRLRTSYFLFGIAVLLKIIFESFVWFNL